MPTDRSSTSRPEHIKTPYLNLLIIGSRRGGRFGEVVHPGRTTRVRSWLSALTVAAMEVVFLVQWLLGRLGRRRSQAANACLSDGA